MTAKLTQFPRPNVAVDLALLTVRPTTDNSAGELATLLLDRTSTPTGQVLPGRFIRKEQTIEQTVSAVLSEKLGLSLRRRPHPRLLRVFDDPHRDERGWTLSIGHVVALPWDEVADARGEWVAVSREADLRSRHLLFDHDLILKEAVASMRDRYETEPDPDRLLRGPFTLLELRRLHEAVLGEEVRKDTFNRRMRPQVEAADAEPLSRPVGRPAQHYVHPPRRSTFSDQLWRLPRVE